MKLSKKIAVSLLGILCTASLAGGISACKGKKPVKTPENHTTIRLALPNDGSLPTAHTGIENIGYMATVLDGQPQYHAYAKNSSKAMGYEQVTQTWKDYKGKELSGYNGGVMICSDLSYSSLVKSGTQACFVNNSAYLRSSSKPGKSTTATSASWNTGTPEFYDKESYLSKYGEFSTELSVYVLNEDTVKSYDDVVTNEDGTYSQTFYLRDQAACYYQNGMKTRGNLKGYPGFEHIHLTFTFDSKWQVLSTYCDEKTKIAPKSLGGVSMTSNSKTSTEFKYGDSEFDGVHYAYFDDYFKSYVGQAIKPVDPDEEKPELLDVLAGGFSKVMDGGQQFNLNLKIGETDYDGKVYLAIGDLGDALNTIDARVALEKKGSGKQDLYIEFKEGTVNAYYSDGFAVTANIDAVKTAIGQFSEWIKRFDKPNITPASLTLTAEEDDDEGGFDLTTILNQLEMKYGDNWVTIDLNTDDLLGTGIGANVNLSFDRAKSSDGSTYSFKSANLSELEYKSDAITLSGGFTPDNGQTITRNAPQTPANIAEYITSVHSLLNSNTVAVDINFDGTKQDVISYLKGLKLDATAYVELGSEIATKVDFAVEYDGVSAELSAFYDIDIHGGNYGKVYLTLKKFNGEDMSAKVYSNISETVGAVNTLLNTINGVQSAATPVALAAEEEQVNKLSGIVNSVLNLNFGKIIGDLTAKNSQIGVTINLDELIGGIGIDVGTTKFGTSRLVLNLDNNKKASLSLTLPALGLEMGAIGSDTQITEPDVNGYFDVTTLVNVVNTAANKAKEIIDSKDLVFDIDTTVIIDNVYFDVVGNGEVVWANNKIRVAVDLTLSVADGTYVDAKDTVNLKLVYDDTVNGDEKPLAKYSVNGIAMEIYRSDLTNLKTDINHITTNIDKLINGEKQTATTARTAIQTYSGVSGKSVDGTLSTVENVLTNPNVQNVLKVVLGFVGDLTIDLEKSENAADFDTLIINHVKNGNLTLGANGGLQLALAINNNNDTQIIDLTAGVQSGNGSVLGDVRADLDALENAYTTSEASNAFATVIYNYLFAVIDDLSLENVLGGKTYTVTADVNGDNSGITALAGVTVNAELYYTERQQGTEVVPNRLTEVDLTLDIKGTSVKANVRYGSDEIYVSITELNGTQLNGISFKASRAELYRAADTIVNLVMNDTFINSAAEVLHPAKSAAAYSLTADTKAGNSAVTDMLAKVLSLNFSELISYNKVEGVNTAVVNVDGIVSALGVNAPAIGTVTAKINPVTHKVEGNAKIEGKDEWVTFSAEATEKKDYGTNWTNDYLDIDFVATLLDDLIKTAKNSDEKLNTLYTFSSVGNENGITININYESLVNSDINIRNVKLTAGFDSNKKFYLTISGALQKSTASILGVNAAVVAKAADISITYCDGYITMGRNGQYKIMTLDYLLTNLLDKNNSPICWLLETDGWVWDQISKRVNLDLGSDLTKPDEYRLYQQKTEPVEPDPEQPVEEKIFNLSKILKGLKVVLNSKEVTTFGDNANTIASTLSLSTDQQKNYYGLDLDLTSLIGNTLSDVYLAILRSEDGGLTGLKLNTKVAGALTVTLNLTNGVNTVDAAENYFDTLNKENTINYNFYDGIENPVTHISKIFGCYSTEYQGDARYAPLNVLGKVTLNVVGYQDKVQSQTVKLKSTSTVYLRDPENILWANGEHKQIVTFVDEEGNELGTKMQITRDMTIYAIAVEAMEVTFDIGAHGTGYSKVLTPDEEIPAYVSTDESAIFVNWADKDGNKVTCASQIPVENGTRTAYAVFFETTREENGVTYTLKTGSDNKTYYVVEKATSLNEKYTKTLANGGEIFVIESELDGIPVTEINAQAFKDSNIKNVIAPASITKVGAEAFMNNYGMESAVFFADTVHFDGTKTDGNDGQRYVFFGCSVSNGSNDSNLHIYYNGVTYPDGASNNWYSYRNNYRLGVGANSGGRHSAGEWSYVVYTQTGADLTEGLACLTNGVKTDVMSIDEITAMVQQELNGRTKSDRIYAYNVTVTEADGNDGYAKDCKYHSITVNITDADTPYYLIDIDVSGCRFDGDVKTFDGKTYAKADTEVTVNPPDGKLFDTFTGTSAEADGDGYKFTMPENGTVTITATTTKAPIIQYTLNSAVAFSYNGQNSQDNKITLQTADVASINGVQPVATGYYFLGWAFDNGTQLEFVDGATIEYSNYYAIWAENRTEVSSVIPVTSGTDPNTATVTVPGDGSFYKWYTDNTFTTLVEEITATNFATNSLLYARLQYDIKLSVTASASKVYSTESEGGRSTIATIDNQNNQTKDLPSRTVLEGAVVSLTVSDDFTSLELSIDNYKITYSAIKRNRSIIGTWSDGSDVRKFNDTSDHTISVNGNTYGTELTGTLYRNISDDGKIINGNITISFHL